eukprot:TRINITY_DN805_c0_g2_i1.p1 TRINITY_DN805_c0_g2~~TRINITY_DN805_c0_g2_i1.p1  ORF type:complete len:421 (-),score=114.51 TRINITY_DN805_c0_g2_i1:103-1365(-)
MSTNSLDLNNSADFSRHSFPKSKIKILLLENIHPKAVEALRNEGFSIETLKTALNEDELKEKIKDVHAIGIRSKTKITDAVLAEAKRLLCVGCFCIGTDQTDLKAANARGIPVFNSPFSNSRSVAELMVGEIICLARRLGDKNKQMHSGHWDKSATNCHEIRGKTLGIVGYGHIGTQLSVLAEALGMKVIFYDIEKIMPLGNSTPCSSLEDLLQRSDFVTLHVPNTPQTNNLIDESKLALMKKGSFLINASRGSVVDLEALEKVLRSGHLNGAAVDVYPTEPEGNIKDWKNPLQDCPNTILTPHIGGSTEEAQTAIGVELADKIIRLINHGTTLGAVNFPNVDLPYGGPGTHRILNVHKNQPGVLRNINNILGEVNVHGQFLATKDSVGYLVVDVESEASGDTKRQISELSSSIRTRILY